MPVYIKFIVIAALICILASLASAFYQFSKRGKDSDDTKMVKALTIRVGLSIALFVFLMVLSALGIITPNTG
ncbi:MAG: twin transmembrane helix small protein [Pseudomonadota bacterium]